jgi:ABC-type branched-subunit amino acid transport system ATPase component
MEGKGLSVALRDLIRSLMSLFKCFLLDILVLQLSLDESTQRSWSCKEIPIPASGKARRQRRPSVLLGEQNIIFALPHDHRVYVLERGRIVWEGGPSRFAIEAGPQYL